MPKIEYPQEEPANEPVDLERARTIEEQDYARVGIPSRFWDTWLKDLKFAGCNFGVWNKVKPKTNKKTKAVKANATPAQQRAMLKQIIQEPRGQLVVLASEPTDEGALAAASSTLIQARSEGYTVQVVNAAYTHKRMPRNTAAYMVHNVTEHATDQKVEAVRDLLTRWRQPARIVVVGRCDDPYSFCVGRLCLKPDFVGFIQDPV